MTRSFRSAEGITIVELLITLSLLGVVVAIVYSIYFFGMASFTRSEQLAVDQQEAREVMRVLVEDIRYATDIKVLQNMPEDPDGNDIYVFVKDGNVHRLSGNQQIVIGNAESFLTNLLFTASPEEQETIHIIVTVGAGSKQYEINTSVLVLNLGSGALPANSGPVLRYRL